MTRMLLPIFLNLALSVSAQITVTAAIFPAAGDTLRFAVDPTPHSSIHATTANGINQFWDFSALEPDFTQEIIYQNASVSPAAPSFPGADLVVISPAIETFYNKTNNRFETTGSLGAIQQAFGLSLAARFQPARVELRAPLTFQAKHQNTSNRSLPFSLNDLPDSLLQGLPQVIDSVRIRLTTVRHDTIDGWGTIRIPGGEYSVLRQKRTDAVSNGFDVKLPFVGWVNIENLGITALSGLLVTDTSIVYRFISGIEKEEIAVASMSNDLTETQRVTFKANPIVANNDLNSPGAASIQAFPNPAVEWVRFDCTNLPADEYTLKVFNVIGKELWRQTQKMAGNKSIRLELEDFKKGTYLYSLIDSGGKTIGTKRLVVLKP